MPTYTGNCTVVTALAGPDKPWSAGPPPVVNGAMAQSNEVECLLAGSMSIPGTEHILSITLTLEDAEWSGFGYSAITDRNIQMVRGGSAIGSSLGNATPWAENPTDRTYSVPTSGWVAADFTTTAGCRVSVYSSNEPATTTGATFVQATLTVETIDHSALIVDDGMARYPNTTARMGAREL